ncbi:hypothetical protein SERLA73DRAFT_74730 [Serpula lacrymans var. lacrymans S7.3]|uniref:DDE-1 domain-containing protein n=1 Tax=Serpula lacrymans var. lacrymans (strain S7.3) TaxID=936435 RepID=F8Q056_SERL3|nr:hypothetical protein SERLA73DRAFT_74730 [Serpula lacrymans var. lacrymans S7.3]
MDMIMLAVENNIQLLCIPPHTTHRLQPLDVGVFGPLQKAWEYWEARKSAFTTNTVLQAWHKSGLCPFNPNIFSAVNYAPSVSTSTIKHAPAFYPDTFSEGWVDGPSSDDPDFIPDDEEQLCEPTIVGHTDCHEHDSDSSSEGMGNVDDGSETSSGEPDDDGNGSSNNSNSNNSNSTELSSSGIRAWLQVSQDALPLEDISHCTRLSQSQSSRNTAQSPSPANSRSATPAAMSIPLQPTLLLMLMSKKLLIEKIHKLSMQLREAWWEWDMMQRPRCLYDAQCHAPKLIGSMDRCQ